MVEIHKIIGRLSNQMFITASHYARCMETGDHFFVQDEKYFEKYKFEIRQMFSAGIAYNTIDKVAVHVRLTDYVGNAFYVDLGHHEHADMSDNYYVKAMAEFPKDTKFLIFSDDIEKAKTMPMFQGEQFEFSEGKTAVEDMNLMASCKGIIIANSSFSWWAAYLSGANKIIAPKQWFSNPADDQYIGIPSTWQRL